MTVSEGALQWSDQPFLRHGDEEFLARVFEPGGQADGRPVLIDVHGGAWCDNDRRAGKRYNLAVAATGVVVVAIDFRTGPDHQHPSGSADVAAAVRWVRANADRLRVNPNRIVLSGSSSGGHLALLAGLMPNAGDHRAGRIERDGAWEADDGDASVLGIAALWPPVDPLARYRYASGLGTEHGARLVANTEAYFGDEETMARASVVDVLRTGRATHHPTVWLAEAETDLNVPTRLIQDLVDEYTRLGDLEHTMYEGVGHGFGHFEGETADRFRRELSDWVHRVC